MSEHHWIQFRTKSGQVEYVRATDVAAVVGVKDGSKVVLLNGEWREFPGYDPLDILRALSRQTTPDVWQVREGSAR